MIAPFLNEEERDLWRRLLSPFPSSSYSSRDGQGGKKFTYLKKRVLENRLDEVIGPGNWSTEYETDTRGVTCRLTLRYNLYNTQGQLVDHKETFREGGGAFKDDLGTADAADKSAYTSAFRVVCAAFGIGRELYGEGMPSFVNDLFGAAASGLPQNQQTMPVTQQQQSYGGGGGYQGQSGGGGGDGPRIDPPIGKTGKAVYAWAKNAGDHFKFDILGLMVSLAQERGLPRFTDKWDETFSNEAMATAMVEVAKMPHYKGEFSRWVPENAAPQQQYQQPQQQQYPQPAQQQQFPMAQAQPGVFGNGPGAYGPNNGNNALAGSIQQNIANNPTQLAQAANDLGPLKKAVAAQMTAYIHSKTGREPAKEELVAMIGQVSASVPDGSGVQGQVMSSMKSCDDKKWLLNMKAWVDRAISDLARSRMVESEEDDGIPC